MRWLLLAITLLLSTAVAAQTAAPALSEPGISPEGREVAFVAGGDIWTVPTGGGEARLLVSDAAMEIRPLYSPDGKMLAFTSTRTGNGDVYVLDFASGATRRLTWDDARDLVDGWSPDSKWVYFSSSSRDISGMNDIWRVAPTGGTPMQVSAERYVNEFFAAPSPDGKSIALNARGFAGAQWWRHGHSHIDESQIVILRDPSSHSYQPVTGDDAKESWAMWAPDGRRLFYMSDRSGNENIWTTTIGGQPQQVTKFTNGRVLWPSISADGRTIVFERDFGIWKLDTASGNASQIPVALRGVPAAAGVEHRRLNDHFEDLAVSPDGKKVAFAARGEIWAASSKDGGDAVRVTNTSAVESQVVWSPDSRSVVYVSDRDGQPHLFQFDFGTEREKQLTRGDAADDVLRFSPDGKTIALQRNGRELVLLDVATGQTRSLVPAHFDRPPIGSERPFEWSPDSKWIAYLDYGQSMFRNAWVVPAGGGTAHPVSFIANTFTDSISWSPDGKFLLMSTGQRTENNRIARVDLVPTTPKFREDQFRDLFREPEKKPDDKEAQPAAAAKLEEKTTPAPAKKKPVDVQVDFTSIRERLRLLPVALDASQVSISADGKWVTFVASVGDDENVYVYSIDELATDRPVPKQLSATSGRKRSLQFSSDSKEVYYLDGGKIVAATIDPPKTRPVAATAEMDVDFTRERDEAFRQAWTYLHDNFFDPAMHGVDWTAVRERVAPHVAAARTPDDFRRLLSLMVGELNASHLGAFGPQEIVRTSTGRIGVRFDRDEYERSGRLRVSEVIPLSPADVAKIRVGETIDSVDGQPVTRQTNFDQLLDYKIGKRIVLGVIGTDTGHHDVTLQPIRNNDEKGLTYRAWVESNRDYVNRISNGRLGYVHMPDMSYPSLERLFVDLDAENRSKDGVVVDIRNNNGGFVNVYAIDVLARRPYLTMTPRDFPSAPARTLLGQRSLEKPTVLVTNRHSLSDAEDFTEGYRSLGLGKVVGEPTAGWIIYTTGVDLVDGTTLRLPFIRITDAHGQDMEMHPRPVDRFVQKQIGEWYAGKDSQLDAAVQELLASLR
ncbi:MAG TPA: S41 family peptidase [Thermoanaerobaculia bacterium]